MSKGRAYLRELPEALHKMLFSIFSGEPLRHILKQMERQMNMDAEGRQLLPKDFPEDLGCSGTSLLDMGSAEVAWLSKDAIKAAEWYATHEYAILGGDVLRRENEYLVYTYDNWYLNQEVLDWATYVEESRKKTVSYIHMYQQRNGDQYYYTLTTAPKGWKGPKKSVSPSSWVYPEESE